MPVSVIIIHCAPELHYREVLRRTIASVRRQNYPSAIEIIVADDGSRWSQELLPAGEDFRCFTAEEVRGEPLLADLPVDGYLLARSSNRYLKALLWNRAVAVASHEHLVFLDDDHPFASCRALSRYEMYLKTYDFVFGRLKNPDRTFRRFADPSVQGTNFALRRALLDRIGGFGEYTADWGCGEDSDLFWKVYQVLGPGSTGEKRACFAADILTRDLCSGRWLGCQGGTETFVAGFQALHGVPPHVNPSRLKQAWVFRPAQDRLRDFCCRVNNYLVGHLRRS